jgi:hypothetical protein
MATQSSLNDHIAETPRWFNCGKGLLDAAEIDMDAIEWSLTLKISTNRRIAANMQKKPNAKRKYTPIRFQSLIFSPMSTYAMMY